MMELSLDWQDSDSRRQRLQSRFQGTQPITTREFYTYERTKLKKKFKMQEEVRSWNKMIQQFFTTMLRMGNENPNHDSCLTCVWKCLLFVLINHILRCEIMYLGVPCLQTNLQLTPAGWEDVSTRWWTPTRLHCITSQMTIFTYRKQKFEKNVTISSI